jgi:hypothetical protein
LHAPVETHNLWGTHYIGELVMPLPPKRDHKITLADAAQLTRRHRDAAGAKAERGGLFPRAAVEELLLQAGCAALRFYYGRREDGTTALVLIGVDEGGNDMLGGDVLDLHYPCPPYCPTPSQLSP